jgi:hypothetical protein
LPCILSYPSSSKRWHTETQARPFRHIRRHITYSAKESGPKRAIQNSSLIGFHCCCCTTSLATTKENILLYCRNRDTSCWKLTFLHVHESRVKILLKLSLESRGCHCYEDWKKQKSVDGCSLSHLYFLALAHMLMLKYASEYSYLCACALLTCSQSACSLAGASSSSFLRSFSVQIPHFSYTLFVVW